MCCITIVVLPVSKLKRIRSLLVSCAFLLCAVAVDAQTVINSGVPGQNTAEIADRVASVLKATRPGIVILFAGMNDAVNDKKFLLPEQSRAFVETIVSNAQQVGASVVLVTVHDPDIVRLMARHKPEVYGSRSPQQRIAAMNAVLSSVAQEHHLALVDFHAVLEHVGGADATYSTDGVHLTSAGYALLAASIVRVLPATAKDHPIVCLGDSLTYGIGVRAVDDANEGEQTYPAQLRRLLAAASGQLSPKF